MRRVLDVDGAIASRDAVGGTAPVRVDEQREALREAVAQARAWAQEPQGR